MRDVTDLRTRTPQGDGNRLALTECERLQGLFKNQNPARGRKHVMQLRFPSTHRAFKKQNPARGRKLRSSSRMRFCKAYLRNRTPQGDGAYLQPPLPERGRGKVKTEDPMMRSG